VRKKKDKERRKEGKKERFNTEGTEVGAQRSRRLKGGEITAIGKAIQPGNPNT
jgi:hypothetical protein